MVIFEANKFIGHMTLDAHTEMHCETPDSPEILEIDHV